MAKSRAAKLGCLVAITGALSLMPGVIEEAERVEYYDHF